MRLRPSTPTLIASVVILALFPSRGTAQAVTPPRSTAAVEEARINLDLQDMDLSDVIQLIAEQTGRNVLYDDRVRGRVTLISPEPVTADEAWLVFESILQTKGFTTVLGPAGIYKIVPVREAKESPIQTSTPDLELPNRDLFITRLIPLLYVKADAITNTLRPLVSSNANMVAYAPTNTIILTDTAANIRRLLTIVDHIDVKTYQEQVKVIPIQFADAGTLAGQLGEIFSQDGARRAAAPRPRTPTRRGTQTPATVESVVGSVGQPRFVTDDRTNSIVVIAPQPTIRAVESLIVLLDYKRKGSGRIHVYRLQNADAEEMAQTLQSLATGGAPAATAAGAVGRAGLAAIAALAEGVRITADGPTNSLIIQASPEGYAAIRDVLEDLDVRRPQVLVEALVMEIVVDYDKTLGAGWLFQSLLDDNDGARIVLGSNTGLGDNPFGGLGNEVTDPGDFTAAILGRTITVLDETGNLIQLPVIQGILTALGKDKDTNIIFAPSILTADNETAEIKVGQNIPVITSRVQSAAGTVATTDLATSNTVERQDVGVTLRVTSQISEGDTVRLEIFQELSAVLSEDPDLGPTTSKRTIENTVYVRDGETVLIGGIITDQLSQTVTKVPFLGDIPILGWAFKSTIDTIDKVNLLVVLTPHIVRDPEDLQRLTLEHRERFRSTGAAALQLDEEERKARAKAQAAGLDLPLDPNPVRRELARQTRRYPVENLPELRELRDRLESERQEEMERQGAVQGGEFIVQVSFFRTPEEAVATLEELMAEGYDGTILSRRMRDELLHYVQLGPYLTEERAQRVAREIHSTRGLSAQVVIQP